MPLTTCSYPNPEIFAALELGLNLAKETDADLMLATDPDADRVGIAMKCPDGSYEPVSYTHLDVYKRQVYYRKCPLADG